MHKSRLGALIIDCETDEPGEYADFWGAVLGDAPESGEVAANSNYVRLNGPPGEVPVILQKVNHTSRVHLDIETDNIEAEVNRLSEPGAVVVERLQRWVVLEAPSGHPAGIESAVVYANRGI